MPFNEKVKREAFIACGRCCCICHKFCGNNMEVHHIRPQAEGGEDTFENAIPLCFDCHAEVGQYNPNHPKGNRFTQEELRGHRDNWYRQVKQGTVNAEWKLPRITLEQENHKDITLVRVQSGKQLLRHINGSMGWAFDHDEPKTAEEAKIIGDFIQLIGEFGDAWEIMSPGEQIQYGFSLNDRIADLEKHGFYLFCGTENRILKGGKFSPESFPIFQVRIVRKDSKEIISLKE